LSRYFRDVLPEEPELDVVMENNEPLHYHEPHWQPGDGHIIKQNIVRELFH